MPDDFYQQELDCGGIPIRASAAVDPRALQVAYDKIMRMLQFIPEVRARLISASAAFSVIGKDEQPSDLPELAIWKDRYWMDNRGIHVMIDTRGRAYGGLHTCCAEEILLNLPCNAYPPKQDICTHEFAHTIMECGFTDVERDQIDAQYKRAMARGLWKKAYAAVDSKEYWAELSIWYFDGHGDRRMTGIVPADGNEGLRAYDPDGWELLKKLYNA